MSDTAIFLCLAADELNSNGSLPGDLRGLRSQIPSDGRCVHLEAVADAPLPEATSLELARAGYILTQLPSATDSVSALVGGLMARLHEFLHAYTRVHYFVLAGTDVERLAAPASFLRRAGRHVILVSPERGRPEGLRGCADEVVSWGGGRSGRGPREERAPREDRGPREERAPREETAPGTLRPAREEAPRADPYEVLVEEVTRGREKGQLVLLTSLKQRMRRRLRRFDETRLKDLEGRPMRKFKDFITDAANRNLIQLIEKGNASHVLLPGEEIPETAEGEELLPAAEDFAGDEGGPEEIDSAEEGSSDPLLDAVDMLEDTEVETDEEPELKELRPSDFDVESVDEDAPAPSRAFMELLQRIIPESGAPLAEILRHFHEMQSLEQPPFNLLELRELLQNAFYNELLEVVHEDQPVCYAVVDDWQRILEFL